MCGYFESKFASTGGLDRKFGDWYLLARISFDRRRGRARGDRCRPCRDFREGSDKLTGATKTSLAALLILLLTCPGWSQTRVQFPTAPPGAAPSNGYWPNTPPSYGTPGATPTSPPPGAGTPLPPQPAAPPSWDPYAEPSMPMSQPYSPYAPSPYAPTSPTAPALPPFGSQPYTPPAPGSPYGAPYGQPGALYPDGLPSVLPEGGIWETVQRPIKFLQEARMRYTWIAANGSKRLGLNELETSASFAFPIIYDQAPLIVTPGFGIHLLDGPVTDSPSFAELPPNVYDAYLDFSWRPQITPWLGANLGVRPGVFTDWQTFTTHSIRIPSRGLGVVTVTPNLQIIAGVVYLDRVDIKLLPAGGIVWTPNADTRWEILFPNPKLASRFSNIGNSEVWWYVAGEYGGGSWTFEESGGDSNQFDYNDIRVMLGLETVGGPRMRMFFEVGYLFERQIVYRSGPPTEYNLSDSFMLRGGLAF